MNSFIVFAQFSLKHFVLLKQLFQTKWKEQILIAIRVGNFSFQNILLLKCWKRFIYGYRFIQRSPQGPILHWSYPLVSRKIHNVAFTHCVKSAHAKSFNLQLLFESSSFPLTICCISDIAYPLTLNILLLFLRFWFDHVASIVLCVTLKRFWT